MSLLRVLCVFGIGLFLHQQVWAEVQSVSEYGFVVVHRREVAASREHLFASAKQIEKWWDPAHSYSGDASNFSIELKPGGMFLERLPGGGFVEHLRVTTVMPGRLVRLTGGLGPLATDGLAGSMTWSFADGETEDSSVLIWRYSVGGYRPDGIEAIANAVDGVIGIQIDRAAKLAGEQPGNEPPSSEQSKTAGIKQLTAHTWTRETATGGEKFAAPSAEIDQFAFIAGRWTGEALGGWCEEVWSQPVGGEMQGMFQFVKEDAVQFRELFTLRKGSDQVWQLRLKHFGATLEGWEEKAEVVEFDLLELAAGRAVFDGLTMELVEPGKLMVYVASKNRDGTSEELEFAYTKD